MYIVIVLTLLSGNKTTTRSDPPSPQVSIVISFYSANYFFYAGGIQARVCPNKFALHLLETSLFVHL